MDNNFNYMFGGGIQFTTTDGIQTQTSQLDPDQDINTIIPESDEFGFKYYIYIVYIVLEKVS